MGYEPSWTVAMLGTTPGSPFLAETFTTFT
jgi:allophanate hydrolase subunit 1